MNLSDFFFYVDMRCSFVALTESIKNTIKKALHLVLQHDRSEGFKGAGTQCDHGEGKKCFEPQFQRKVKSVFSQIWLVIPYMQF